MKKRLSLLLVFAVMTSVTACGKLNYYLPLGAKDAAETTKEDIAEDEAENTSGGGLTEVLNKLLSSVSGTKNKNSNTETVSAESNNADSSSQSAEVAPKNFDNSLNFAALSIEETIERQKRLAADAYATAFVYIDENDICYCYGTDRYGDGSNSDLRDKLVALNERGEKAVQVYLGYSELAAVLGSGGTVLFDESEFFPSDHILFICYAGGNIYGVTSQGNVVYSSVAEPEIIYHAQGLSNVKYLTAYSEGILVAINNDGTVSLYQQNEKPIKVASDWSSCDVSGWTDILWAVPSVYFNRETLEDQTYIVGLKQNGTVVTAGDCPADFGQWEHMVYLLCDSIKGQILGLRSDGTILSVDESLREDTKCLTWEGIQAFTSSVGIGRGKKLYGQHANKLESGFLPDGTSVASDFTVMNDDASLHGQ